MNMKDILHTISDKSSADQSNLWYSIEQEIKDENRMRKTKNRRVRMSLTLVAAMIGFAIIGALSMGRTTSTAQTYHRVTLDEIQAMSTPIDTSYSNNDMSITVDWAYADASQIVLAYTVFDAEGNPLTGDDNNNGSVELNIMWHNGEGYSSPGRDQYLNRTETTQQIARFTTISTHFYSVNEITNGNMDLRNLPALDLRVKFHTGGSDELYSVIPLRFEVPYRDAYYEQHNNFTSDASGIDWTSPANDVEIYFEDLTVADSSTIAHICYRLPETALSGIYVPREVNLYADDQKIEGLMIAGDVDAEDYLSNSVVDIDAYYYTFEASEEIHAYCAQFFWHIAFDVLPETLRIEIPALYTSQIPTHFESEEQRQYYAELYADEGYDLVLDPDSDGIMSSQFPDAWYDLNLVDQTIIRQRVFDTFFETYPPDPIFTQGWQRTFNLNEVVISDDNMMLHAVNLDDIAQLATPLNITQTHDDRTITIDWAYADANNLVIAYTVYDENGDALNSTLIPQEDRFIRLTANDQVVGSYQVSRPAGYPLSNTQQIIQLQSLHDHVREIAYETNGEVNLLNDNLLSLRVDLSASHSASPSFAFSFAIDVPYQASVYEHNNDYLSMRDKRTSTAVDSDDIQVIVNDIVVTNTAVTSEICMRFPSGTPVGIYTPDQINLYGDGVLIETRPFFAPNSDIPIQSIMSFHVISDYSMNIECYDAMWNLAFDVLPNFLRVEVNGIEQQTLQSQDTNGNQQYGNAQIVDDRTWNEVFTVPRPTSTMPLYGFVSSDDIAQRATPINQTITHNLSTDTPPFTMQVDWAYADANQIVMGVTYWDENGDMMVGNEVPVGSIELWQTDSRTTADDDNPDYINIWNFGREPLVTVPEIGEQVIIFTISPEFTRDQADAITDNLLLKADFLIETAPNLHATYPVILDIPYQPARFTHHNDDLDMDDPAQIRDEPVHNVEFYVTDVIITDTATSANVCFYLPDGSVEGVYRPEEIRLYANGLLVNDVVQPIGNQIDYMKNDYEVIEFANTFTYSRDERRAFCETYQWAISFNQLPTTIRLELTGIERAIPYTENDNTRDLYIELYAEQGWNISAIETNDGYTFQFPSEWLDLSTQQQEAVISSVNDAFKAIYPDVLVYSQGNWEYNLIVNRQP